jgi:hypothetical protein
MGVQQRRTLPALTGIASEIWLKLTQEKHATRQCDEAKEMDAM